MDELINTFIAILEKATIPGVWALAMIIVARPLVPPLVRWWNMKLDESQKSNESSTKDRLSLLEARNKKIMSNDLVHIERDMHQLSQRFVRFEAHVNKEVGDIRAAGHWNGSMISFSPATASGPANVKSINGLAKASVKTINGLAIASVKTYNGLT